MFCAGGIATPADASLVMQLGAEGVFVGSGIFKSEDPAARAAAIVEATTHFADAGARRRGLRGARRRDDEHRVAQAARRAAAGPARLVGRRGGVVVGVLALQGDFEAHGAILRVGSAPRCARSACRATSTVSTRSCCRAGSRRR
jgi:hypothetical protein